VQLGIVHLEGCVAQWQTSMAKYTNGSSLSWKAYSTMVRKRSGDVCIDPMDDFMKLCQTSIVEEYYDAFDTIINKLNLSTRHCPKSFSLARVYEAANTSTATNSSWYLTKNKGILGSKPVTSEKTELLKDANRRTQQLQLTQTLTPAFMN